MVIRRVGGVDVALLRAVRLRSLVDAPYAFSSSHEIEEAYDFSTWEQLAGELEVGATFLALETHDAGEASGMAGGYFRGDQRTVATLWGMWVAPEARDQGAGQALVEEVADWARGAGARSLRLSIAEGAELDPALRLYHRCGFVATGEHEPFPSDPTRRLRVMVRQLV
jgi:ribosomal protein S18 acetylase RimI-like enzyme